METDIQRFFKKKCVFLTGGTGFLGKVVLEKLLRVTDVERVYVLMRPKRGRSIEERMYDILKDPLFEKLQQLKPQPGQRITVLYGDCVLPHLGLSKADRAMLAQQVHVVVHSAATVRFNEPLATALAINVRATLDLIELAKSMVQLQAFVHVSSAFANCLEPHIAERFYTERLSTTAQKACQMADALGPEMMNRMTQQLCQGFPNTYCYTKALAEEAVLSQGRDLPVCIFRPGIIISTCKEPLTGWIDNLYGPTSILFGVAYGVLRIMYMKIEAKAHIVPVDFCANTILAAAWSTARSQSIAEQVQPQPQPQPQPQSQLQLKLAQDQLHSESQPQSQPLSTPDAPPAIYNLVPDESNSLKWANYRYAVEEHGMKMPLSRMIWFPFMIHTDSKLLYNILCFFYHTIPGYIFDMVLFLLGKKRRMVKTYRKIHRQTALFEYFVENEWTFDTSHLRQLWKSMSPDDQQLFDFDMRPLNWSNYFLNNLKGMRIYLSKEEPTTIPKGLQLMSRLLILHRAVQCLVYGGGTTLLLFTISRLLRVF